MKIKLECQEANHLCDKNQYRETSFWEKVKLNFHLIYCRACRKYTVRNNKLSKVIKDPRVKSVKIEDKKVLKERIQQEVAK
ncbi:MAG: hypothetical protein KJO23_02015 [Bacteroidia bacterium]|nr:hypothetical protein [Bacteroidia bacterium]NNM22202.1 hypothetical protein [Flavobacteriaceae bacterium]